MIFCHSAEHHVGIFSDFFADRLVFVFHVAVGDGKNNAELFVVKGVVLGVKLLAGLLKAALIIVLAGLAAVELLSQHFDFPLVYFVEIFIFRKSLLHFGVFLFKLLHLLGKLGVCLGQIVKIIVGFLAVIAEKTHFHNSLSPCFVLFLIIAFSNWSGLTER